MTGANTTNSGSIIIPASAIFNSGAKKYEAQEPSSPTPTTPPTVIIWNTYEKDRDEQNFGKDEKGTSLIVKKDGRKMLEDLLGLKL